MELIVADANIFVYLFRCSLLEIFLQNESLQIKITEAVFNEICDANRRISREHPNLRELILKARHDTSFKNSLEVLNIQQCLENISVIDVYLKLEHEGELDKGEIESIPLALELEGQFLSNDNDAIKVANNIKNGLGISFLSFCKKMYQKNIFSEENLKTIELLLEQY